MPWQAGWHSASLSPNHAGFCLVRTECCVSLHACQCLGLVCLLTEIRTRILNMTACQCGASSCITALCGDVCVFFSCVSGECGFVSVACVAEGLLTLDDGQLRHRLNMQDITNTVLYWRTKKTTHLTMKSSPQEDKLPTQIIYMG